MALADLNTFDLDVVYGRSAPNIERLLHALDELQAIVRDDPRRLRLNESHLQRPGQQQARDPKAEARVFRAQEPSAWLKELSQLGSAALQALRSWRADSTFLCVLGSATTRATSPSRLDMWSIPGP